MNYSRMKDHKIGKATNTAQKEKDFESFRNAFQNEAITELVKNNNETHRIIEKDGKFIQKRPRTGRSGGCVGLLRGVHCSNELHRFGHPHVCALRRRDDFHALCT